jgi:hypothetical protein
MSGVFTVLALTGGHMANADVGASGSLVGLLKTTYPQKDIKRVGYKNHPFYAMVKKNTGLAGEPMAISIRYASQSGASSLFSAAQANKRPNKYTAWQVRSHDEYAIGGITTKAIRLARGDKGAIVDALKEEMAGLAYIASLRMAYGLYKNGGGAIAQVGSGEGTPTLTLAEPNDIVFFQVGMALDGSTDDGTTGSVITGGVGAVITAVNRDDGTITTTGGVDWDSATAITGIVAGDYLFPKGDFGIRLKGLDAWLPATAPTGGDSFYGVDRSVESNLSGNRVTAQATIQETLLWGMERTFREGGQVDTIFMHPSDYRALIVSLGSQVVYNSKSASDMADVGFKGVEIVGIGTSATVHPDPMCPKGYAFGLQLDTWTLWSAGDTIGVLNDDGNKMLRDGSSDSIEIRMGGYPALVCDAPWCNFRAALPT